MAEKEKVVVIGGAGFLGSHIADELTGQGYQVTVFDLRPSAWLQPGQEMVVGDVFNQATLQECMEGAKYVFHLAAVADIGHAVKSPKSTIEHNIIGSVNVIEACLATNVERLLFASTVYVYSQKGSFYRVSKQAVEAILENYSTEYGLSYTTLRYGSLYGPRAQNWNGIRRFVSQAVREGRVTYPGSGQEKREYIHVKDAAKLSLKAMAAEYRNRCLTITGTQVMTTRELLLMIREIIGHDVELEFSPAGEEYNQFHYSLTPYRYTPKAGHKIVPNEFVDLGQGILGLIEEEYEKIRGQETA